MKNTQVIDGFRIAADRISTLGENEIFVFGSNIQGAHGGGAAWFAHKAFGAEWGVGEGLTGRTYAPGFDPTAPLNKETAAFERHGLPVVVM